MRKIAKTLIAGVVVVSMRTVIGGFRYLMQREIKHRWEKRITD